MSKAERPSMTKSSPVVTWLSVVSLALWLGGCAGVSTKGSWQEGAPRNQTFSRLLVIGVSPDRNIRCAFESTFTSQLRSASTTVFSSCDQMKPNEALNRENVERAVAAVHADGVLVTRLVSASASHKEGTSDDMRGNSVYKATDFAYGAYGMPVTYVDFQTAPPLTSITSSLHILTQLYETQNAKMIYTIDTTTKLQEVDSTGATLMTITAPTADRLRRAGLIH
jgi:hypothetical protein